MTGKKLSSRESRRTRISEAVGEHFLGFGYYFAALLSLMLCSKFIFMMAIAVRGAVYSESSLLAVNGSAVENRIGTFLMIVVPLCAALFSSALLYCAGMHDNEKDNIVSVTLIASDGPMKSFLDALAGRHQIFKNSVRNWPELQALYIFSMYVMAAAFVLNVFWLLSLFGDAPVALSQFWSTALTEVFTHKLAVIPVLAGPLMVVYGYLKKDYGDKWQYCADLQNKFEFSGRTVTGSREHVALTLDLMNLDLWAKRSFCRFFFKEVRHAIQTASKDSKWKEEKMNQLGRHCLPASDIEELLNSHLHGVLYQEPKNQLRNVA